MHDAQPHAACVARIKEKPAKGFSSTQAVCYCESVMCVFSWDSSRGWLESSWIIQRMLATSADIISRAADTLAFATDSRKKDQVERARSPCARQLFAPEEYFALWLHWHAQVLFYAPAKGDGCVSAFCSSNIDGGKRACVLNDGYSRLVILIRTHRLFAIANKNSKWEKQ